MRGFWLLMLIVLTDLYHTYLSIAAAAVVSLDPKWEIQPLGALINATHDTVRWAKTHVRGSGSISMMRSGSTTGSLSGFGYSSGLLSMMSSGTSIVTKDL